MRSTATVFSYPSGIAVNNDYVFVSNTGSSIEKFTRSNLNQAGYQNFGSGEVYWPFGMSMNNAGNKLILANWHGRRFTEFNVAGSTLNFSRSLYRGRQGFDADYDSNGNIFGAEAHRLRKYNSSLTYQNQIASNYNMPLGVHLDSSDNILVADHRKSRLVKYNSAGVQQFQVGGGRAKTRLRAARDVIKKIVSNTDLTSGANFGLMEWGTRHRIRVKIGPNGASRIFNNVNGIRARGGTDLREALKIVRDHFNNGKVPDWNLTCSNNYLIVISDGRWVNHNGVIAIARNLAAKNIKTFAVGFNINSGAQANYVDLAKDGGTTTPLYADNEAQLLAKLTDAIKQAISGKLTFTTPAVMSDVQRNNFCLLYTSPSPRDLSTSRMPSSA